MNGYRFFDHTADIGMQVESATLDDLFLNAAKGLAELVVSDPTTLHKQESISFEIENDDLSLLFFDFLNELLFRFETEGKIFWTGAVSLDVDNHHLTAHLAGDVFDPERHPAGHEVKAVTYHQLSVRRECDGWIAEVIFDI